MRECDRKVFGSGIDNESAEWLSKRQEKDVVFEVKVKDEKQTSIN